MTLELDKDLGMRALKRLDEKIAEAKLGKIKIVIGGGGSMMIHHGYDGYTRDIDAVPLGIDFITIKPLISEVATEMKLDDDWFNPHFQTFTIYLTESAKERYEMVYSGESIAVYSLGAEDLLIMKFMAGRSKDMSHIYFLLKKPGIDLGIVEDRLHELEKIFPKVAKPAIELFYELTEQE